MSVGLVRRKKGETHNSYRGAHHFCEIVCWGEVKEVEMGKGLGWEKEVREIKPGVGRGSSGGEEVSVKIPTLSKGEWNSGAKCKGPVILIRNQI